MPPKPKRYPDSVAYADRVPKPITVRVTVTLTFTDSDGNCVLYAVGDAYADAPLTDAEQLANQLQHAVRVAFANSVSDRIRQDTEAAIARREAAKLPLGFETT